MDAGVYEVSLGFVEGLNNKIQVIQRRVYALRDEEYLRLKVLTCMLPRLRKDQNSPTLFHEDPKNYSGRICRLKVRLPSPALPEFFGQMLFEMVCAVPPPRASQ